MKTSPVGRQLIESFEGLILGAYDDANDHIVEEGQQSRGTLTIGYGHTNAAGPPKVFVGDRITKEQADAILASDLAKVEANVTNLVKVPINQNQFDALVSFQFNLGSLGRSSVLRKLNAKDYKGAADAMLAYDHAMGQKLPGLTRRRQAERNLFLKPSTTSVVTTTTTGAVIAGTAGAVAAAPHNWHYFVITGVVVLLLGGIAFAIYEKVKK